MRADLSGLTAPEARALFAVAGPASGAAPAVPDAVFLDPLQQAVIDGRRVRLGYVARDRRASTRLVDPLGVVSKAGIWYLVAGTDRGQRTFRVDRVTSVDVTDEPAARPDGFDLAAAWILEAVLRSRLDVGAPTDGGVEAVVRGHSPRAVAGELAGFGSWLRVVSPEEVCTELARVGTELVARYGTHPAAPERGDTSAA